MDDHLLLQRYAASRDAQAFDELVRRYQPLVRAAALRQVADAHLAQDITQATLMALVRKAGRIRHNRPLGPWLLRVTHYLAVDALRGESVRRRHERLAARQRREGRESSTPSPLRSIEPILDEMLHALNNNDRTVLVLRYLQEWTIEQIAGELSLTPQATRQRLSRALRRLRRLLERRGVRRDQLMSVPLLLQFHAKIKRAAYKIRERLGLKALVAVGAFTIVAGGFVLIRAELRRTPANPPAVVSSNPQSIVGQQVTNSRPNSTIP
jgi:RNA polymerase sigma-70 factor (ECF subfamily)